MKKDLLTAGCIAIMIICCSCESSMKVSSDYDRAVDFKKYKTFSVYQNESIHDAISQLNQQRILAAVRNEMITKGFQESADNPDLLVNVVAVLKDRVAVTANTNYYGYGGVYRPYYWGTGGMVSGTTNYDVQHYKDGSLIIDIIDAQTKNLVWQGIGNREIDAPLKDPETRVPKGINSIMAAFPPGAAKKK